MYGGFGGGGYSAPSNPFQVGVGYTAPNGTGISVSYGSGGNGAPSVVSGGGSGGNGAPSVVSGGGSISSGGSGAAAFPSVDVAVASARTNPTKWIIGAIVVVVVFMFIRKHL